MPSHVGLSETTALLQKPRTPFPWNQFWIIAFLDFAQPIAGYAITPCLPQFIRDIGVTGGDEALVGYYVGSTYTAFYFTRALSVFFWARLSDRIGRKPVIAAGLFGICLAMLLQGVATTFPVLIASRALSGAMVGIVGATNSMVAEMTDSTNIATAYAWIPVAFALGLVVGPLIGGTLASPAEWSRDLAQSEFLRTHPYFLSSVIPALIGFICWICVMVFLKETVKHAVPLTQAFGKKYESAYPTTTKQSYKSLLTRRVIFACLCFACQSFVDTAFRSLQTLFLASPPPHGLDAPPAIIGQALSLFGILNGIFQILLFPAIHRRWGSRRVFLAGIAMAIPMFLLFPVIEFAAVWGLPAQWTVVGVQIILSIGLSMTQGCMFIYVSGSAPTPAGLGFVHGVSQVGVNLLRGTGPAVASSLYSLNMQHGWLGGRLVYLILAIATALMVAISFGMPEDDSKSEEQK